MIASSEFPTWWENCHVGRSTELAICGDLVECRLMLGSSVHDVLPVSQSSREICSLTGLDQVVADAGGQGVGDLLHQCVARPLGRLAKRSAYWSPLRRTEL
jgi:hypothetical protein